MKWLGRIVVLLAAAIGSILAVQHGLRRLYHRWHSSDISMREDSSCRK